jgi:two-component system chemotaxis response regulator CheY
LGSCSRVPPAYLQPVIAVHLFLLNGIISIGKTELPVDVGIWHVRCSSDSYMKQRMFQGGETDMAKRVLVVDDANFMRTIVKDTLTPHGFQICGEAVNGNEAVSKYRLLKPDLVTMDITMKVKDGLEAAREILQEDPQARIIMVTALGQEKMLMDCLALGVKDFVVKPFEADRIVSAVEKALA